jgi:hypothetical protein
MRPLRYASVLTLSLALAACGGKTLVVESDTEWAGTAGGVGDVAGRGSARYGLDPNADESCWSLSKLTEAGTLHAYAETSTWFGLGSDVSGEMKTSAPMGSVQGCVR